MSAAPVIGGVRIESVERPFERTALGALLAGTTGPVVPVGGDRWDGITGPLALALPEAPPLGLDLTHLDRVVDYQPDDLTITVEAGMRVNALTLLLAQKGLCVPLPTDGFELTVGAVISEARRPAQAAGYDGPRRHLLGLTVLDGAGHECRAGGRVVKNVAGYDLMKLHTGARETLGLLVELTFKLTPLPEVRVTLTAQLPDAAAVDDLTRRLVHSDIRPAAWVVTTDTYGLNARLDLDGFDEDTALEAEMALELIASVGGTPTGTTTLPGREAGLKLFDEATNAGPDRLELALPSMVIGPAVRALGVWPRGAGASVIPQRYAPLLMRGSLGFTLGAPDGPDAAAIRGAREMLLEAGIRCRLRSSRGSDDLPPPLVLDHATIDGPPDAGRPLMAQLKHALDPDRRFSPGLHFWGL